MVGLKDGLVTTRLKVAALIVIAAGTLYAWQGLWREYPKAREGLYSRRIDSYMPDLTALRPETLRHPREAARYLAYYQLIGREASGTSGVSELLGYCSYYSGDAAGAAGYFGQALRSSSDAFAARYNAGILCFLRKDYARAAEYFQQAVAVPQGRAFAYVMGSKVFSQFRVANRIAPSETLVRLQRAYGDAALFIKACLEEQGRSGELMLLAVRYNELRKAWSANGGGVPAAGLLVF
ncbi:MAG: tetratricopeptide repeat protein [Candidatus Omnitrophota bacterium]